MSHVLPACAALLLLVASSPSVAQSAYDGPPSCRVRGLNPRGDGFLSIRTGPSTKNREIGRLVNGDFAYLDGECRGSWCHADSFERGNGRPLNMSGWISTSWCEFYP